MGLLKTHSTPQVLSEKCVRLEDGTELSADGVIYTGQDGFVKLSSADVLPGASADDVHTICAMPDTIGDDHVDVLMGAFNMAKNNELLDWPLPFTITDAPAIVIGSGPSLEDHIDDLIALRHSCLLICSHSAAKRLCDAGIMPHVICPKERTTPYDWQCSGLDSTVIYAGLTLVPEKHGKYRSKFRCGDDGLLSAWGYCCRNRATGPSSGTFALSVAIDITTGPIYMVGMDNCGGHYTGYTVREIDQCETVMCHDGIMRGSHWLFRVCRANISAQQTASGDRIRQTSNKAAVIPNVPLEPLPLYYTKLELLPINSVRSPRQSFLEHLARLPEDWERLYAKSQVVSQIGDTHWEKLVDGHNSLLVGATLAPLYAQLSIQRRMGMSDADVLGWFREAMRNIIDIFGGTINKMGAIGLYDG